MVFYLTGSLCGLEKCDALHLRAPTVECIRAREEGRRSISAARKRKARLVLVLVCTQGCSTSRGRKIGESRLSEGVASEYMRLEKLQFMLGWKAPLHGMLLLFWP